MNKGSDPVGSEGRFNESRLGSIPIVLLGVGAVGIILSILLGASNRVQFAHSWLFAFIYCYTICCGSLFWILLHHAVDADWSVIVRRILENVVSLFPILFLLFIPIIFYAQDIYGWMKIKPGVDVLLDNKRGYLNESFFYIRIGLYFAFFIGYSYFMKRFSTEQDQTGNAFLSLRMRKMAYAGIPLFALSLTFSAFDWLMGLDFKWYSTMWGVYIFAGSALNSMALLILVANALHANGYLKHFTPEHNHIMGKLLFSFIVFWAYISFSQYFLIYYSNIPEETWFFRHRNIGSWWWVSLGLVICHFAVPFCLVITQPAKRNPRRLCFAAVWVLVMHAVDIYWIIMPQMQVNYNLPRGFQPHWLDLSIIPIIALLAYFFIRALPKHLLYPIKDPRVVDSIHLKN